MIKKICMGLMFFWCALSMASVQAQCPVGSDQDGDFCYTVSDEKVTITDYTGPGGDVVIPDTIDGNPVAILGVNSFASCASLATVDIPDSVIGIGIEAFSGCTSLTSITIPDSVTNIGSNAFMHCTSLTSVTIGSSVIIIERSAFYHCTSLTDLTIGNSVRHISGEAFQGCTGLTSVTIPDSVVFIEERAFSGCTGLSSVTFGDSVRYIRYSAFAGCTSLTSIDIPEGVTSIEDSTFAECTGLTSVTIPDSVASIGNSAFSNCTGLTSIVIPDSVTAIGSSAFAHCTGLTSFIIPNRVTTISPSTFSGCTGLASVTIPNSVNTIDFAAFNNCIGLTSIAIPHNVSTIRQSAFAGCTSLNSINIPYGVKTIGTFTFNNCTGLTSITIPNSVNTIERNAFTNCTGLTSITIPNSVNTIGYDAFYGCSSLSVASFLGNAPSMGNDVFYNCAPDFTVCYISYAAGFTSPTWKGYPAADCACAYDSDCPDSLFCNGEEYCLNDVCTAGVAPCGQACDEVGDQCVECVIDDDCEGPYGCEDFACFLYPTTSKFLTVSLSGPGVADVYYYPNEQNIALIQLTGTTERSSLSIKTTLKTSPVYLTDLNIDGSIKSIEGKNVVLTGNMAATDGIGKIHIAETEAGSSIEAAWVGSLSTAFDFAGDMQLSGTGLPPKNLTLGKATIKGWLDNAQLIVKGNVGTVTVGTWSAGSTLAVGVEAGDDGRFFTDDDVPTGGWLKKVKFKNGIHTYNNGERFGIITDEFYMVKAKDRDLLPIQERDFCIWEK